jgi:class 3 adenylate cyclase
MNDNGAAKIAEDPAPDERMLRAQLANMRQKISAPAEALIGYGRDVQEQACTLGLDGFVADIDQLIAAAQGFQTKIIELLDPNRAKDIQEIADLQKARSVLRHDLSNPISAVLGYAEMLLEDAEDANATLLIPDIQKLIKAAEALVAEIEIIVDFSTNAPTRAPSELSEAMATAKRILDDIQPILTEDVKPDECGHILVVDDIDVNRDLLARQLTRQGHMVTVAEGGRQALALMRQNNFDLVLLDLMMPEISGLDVLKFMKSDDQLRDLPVIVISALEEQDSAIRCIEAGAEDYLTKPINPVLMRARIRAGLDKVRIRQLENDYRNDLEAEKKKFEALLLNILPRPIIDRLAAGETIADTFDHVTVLFSDFVGFTRLSRSHPSDRVVATLNRIFSEFDALALRLGVEKIKTIGDGYLAVAGIPIPTDNHAETCAEMAIGMLDILKRLNPTFDEPLEMRLGLASGPVIAGIIGSHKFAFDIWGDTVNMAARHESYSEPNRIHVALETATLLEPAFRLESRGILNIRGRGQVETFFLNGKR